MRRRHAWVAPLLVLLAGCQVARRPSPVTLRGAAHRPAPPREEPPVAAEWSFSTASGECVATASGPPRSPALTVRVAHATQLTAAPSRGASRIAFSGPGGSWAVRTQRTGREVAAALPLDEAAVARLLALVEGGRLRLDGGPRAATLLLPDAGVSGRDWIGCVSGRARAASSAAE